ncbi:glycoside hydrolase [Leucogyrophana mollusca]|uniref:Glycoside hydrolase n=1 Tax=Leucogyrophana mollusca TaxID=85980 RepID=A0ACB8BI31_9AGAM|nr:glycoside hydrolase [Leucogyrophana mollusca]
MNRLVSLPLYHQTSRPMLKFLVALTLSTSIVASLSTTAPPSSPATVEVSAPTTGPSKLTGKTPALGWNTWNAYGCSISESLVIAAANQFISLGLKQAGYQYINIDDCWSEKDRDNTTQRIVPDSTKFANGIDSVAAQVHDLGLQIGIYSDAGTNTCAGYPGSLGYESIDAATFNDWGIDYLKYDNCHVPSNWTDSATPPDGDWYNSNSAIRYRRMTGALAAQSRPVQFSLCIWGRANVWGWGARVGHSWRISGDANASWAYITSIININVGILDAVTFYAHNDMDMMEIGNGNLTIEEERTHFAVWAFLKSPILLGTDLSKLSAAQLAIITNAELIAFHQDPLVGAPAKPFNTTPTSPATTPPEYYTGESSKGTHVFIINLSDVADTKVFDFANLPGLGDGTYMLCDMWIGAPVAGGPFTGSFSVSVAAHDTAAFLVTPYNG